MENANIRSGYRVVALQGLIDWEQVTVTAETRPNSIGKPERQNVYRLAIQS